MNPPSATVTVLIAAYNAAPFLDRAVRSALDQTPGPLEILIVDDCSTDGTASRVEAMAAQDSRVRLLRQAANGGPSRARNAGLDAASGEWVAILDADDAYEPGRLATLLDRAADCDIVFDNFCYYNVAASRVSGPALRTDGAEAIGTYDFVDRARPYRDEADYGMVKPMFRKAFLDTHRLRYATDIRHGEDFLLMVDALLAGAICRRVPEAGYLYTDRTSGFSRTTIDYDSVLATTSMLRKDPRLTADARLGQALNRRLTAIRRLRAERTYRDLKRGGRYGAIARALVTDPAMRGFLMQLGLQKTKRREAP